jgi:glycerol uptake facilitator-like aquaporin
MLIQTNSQAEAAIAQLSDDLTATATQVAAYQSNVDAQDAIGGPLASALNFGSSDVVASATSLLNQIASYALQVGGTLIATNDPLTPTQVQQMQELQREVIDARSTVGQTISDVSWTFGDVANDVVNSAVNLGSQAVGAIVNATGINWTYVKIGGAIVGVILVYALYQRVRG